VTEALTLVEVLPAVIVALAGTLTTDGFEL
jgi:hypothetical protein